MIGILGGTFDPIHLGHVQLAKEVLKQIKFEKIYFIPCFSSAHHKKIQASPEQRLALVKMAIKGQPHLLADDIEIKRQGISYTFDTIKSFRQKFPNAPLALIVSDEVFVKFTTWHKWKEILKYAHLIVTNRPGFTIHINEELEKLIKKKSIKDCHLLSESLAGRILFLTINSLAITSTEVRSLIKNQGDVKHLLPEKVWQYIMQHDLYK